MSACDGGLLLNGGSLCSKWGFDDGDCPDKFADLWEDSGRDYDSLDWHRVLADLVASRLLPVVREHHEVEVYTIETIHNPIRARSVDTVVVDDYAEDCHVLDGLMVVVPWAEVMAVALADQPDRLARDEALRGRIDRPVIKETA